jgi:hypothetical protein
MEILFMMPRHIFFQKFFPAAMLHRDIFTRKKLREFSSIDKEIYLRENRILQPGFLADDPVNFFKDMLLIEEEWLTDCCCPSAKAEIILNIAAKLVTEYKIDAQNLDQKAHEVYISLIKNNPSLLQDIDYRITTSLKEWLSTLNADFLEIQAIKRLKKNNIANPTSQQIEAAKRIEIGLKRRELTQKIVSEVVTETMLAQNCAQNGLIEKELHNRSENHDISILGAAGSGKSTVLRSIGVDRRAYCVLSTDDYRAFTLPGTKAFESKNPQGQAFARSQDFAYLVKEKVIKRLQRPGKRANIICDCITLDYNMRELLAESRANLASFVTAFSGGAGYVEIAERAHNRAEDTAADPADKFRHVHTTSLLEGHAEASSILLSSIPSSGITVIYNTNIPKSEPPRVMAEIDNDQHIIKIYDFQTMAEFLNKSNINIEAHHPIELIVAKREKDTTYPFITHPRIKAESLLKFIMQHQTPDPKNPRSTPYKIQLAEIAGQPPYVSFVIGRSGNPEFEVHDRMKLNMLLDTNNQRAQILQFLLDKMEECNTTKQLSVRP